MPDPEFISEVARLILTENVPITEELSEQALVRRMRPIFAALTVLHETHLDRNSRIVCFYVLLFKYWFEKKGERTELFMILRSLDCFDEVWAALNNQKSSGKLPVLLQLYTSVSKALGVKGGFRNIRKKHLRRIEITAAFVRTNFDNLNIVLLAETVLLCNLVERQSKISESLRAHFDFKFESCGYRLPTVDWIAKAIHMVLCNPPLKEEYMVRRWDKETPAGIHPLWAALLVFFESSLPLDARVVGFWSLIFHEWLEENDPEHIKVMLAEINCGADAGIYVQEMSFLKGGFRRECAELFNRRPFTICLKTLDKCSNFLDGKWMDEALEKKERQTTHLKKICEYVSQTFSCYEPLFCVHLAQKIIVRAIHELKRNNRQCL